MSVLVRALRAAILLLLPIAVALAFLWFGRVELRESEVPPPGAPPEVATPPDARTVRLRLERPDGSPAADAVVLFTAPVPFYAEADADGGVEARFLAEGSPAFFAHARGCRTLRHDAGEELAEVLRFEVLPEARIAPVEGTARRALQVRVRAGDTGEALAGALVAARPAGDDAAGVGTEPWFAFANADGIALLTHVARIPMTVEIYAPGLPPQPHALLARLELTAEADEIPDPEPAVARVRLTGLTADELVHAEREDVAGKLALRLAPTDGTLTLGPWPPGRYRLRHAGSEQVWDLQAGTREIAWGD